MTTEQKTIKSLDGYQLIAYYLTQFMFVVGVVLMVPAISLLFYPSEYIIFLKYFFPPAAILMLVGVFTYYYFKSYEKNKLARHQDAVLVVLIWIMSLILSGIPFLFMGYSFTHAIFETTSGYSTTGLTIVDVTTAPKILLMFRSFMQFFGGVGFVLVLTSVISNQIGMRLYQAEGHNDQLVPNLLKSAKYIMRIYILYIVIGIIFYVIFGMPLYDAINHSISAVATGGFSVKAASIAAYQSVAIEVTTIVLMILGGTNFFVHYILLIKREFKSVFAHIELKVFAVIASTTIVFSLLSLMSYLDLGFGEALRQSSFQLISAITGTGYQTIPSFKGLPSTMFFFIILTMILGAGMGSTAGGIKQYRIGLMAKSQYWQIQEMLSHKKTIRARMINRVGKKFNVEKEDMLQNYMFITTYIIVLLLGTVIIMAYNHSFEDALFEFASALGTVGLSVGIMNSSSPALILWTGTFGMFLGRLEFYVVFIATSKLILDVFKKKVV
ncbi:MAG: TrkH family potassium uptake protein [Acholeplasmataceae bacterium]